MNLPVTAFTNGAWYAYSTQFPYNSAELIVPAESLDNYKKAYEWKEFKKITGSTSEITAVIVPESISMKVGETAAIPFEILPDSTIDKTVVWTSSDESVATIDAGGSVTAFKAGQTVVTATVVNGLAGTCMVTVTDVQTGVEEISAESDEGECYDLYGRVIKGKPERGSIVVRGGKKVLVK